MNKKGFTLIELSVVLIIIALVLGGSLALGSAKVSAERQKQTSDKIDVIIDNLRKYISTGGNTIANGIPCPSSPTVGVTDATFGVSNCAGAGVVTPASASNMRVGAVPVKAIFLPDEYAFDAWGNKFTWVADIRYDTATELLTNQATSNDIIEMRTTQSGAAITQNAVFFIESHGPNGHGAWKKGSGNRINKAVADVDERQNTKCAGDITVECSSDNVFIIKTKTTSYDDITAYRMRFQIIPTALSGGLIINSDPLCNRPYSNTGAIAALTAYTCPSQTPRRCMPFSYSGGGRLNGLYTATDQNNFTNMKPNLSGVGNDIPAAISNSAVVYLCLGADGSSVICPATLNGTFTLNGAPGTFAPQPALPHPGNTVAETREEYVPDTASCFWWSY